MSSSWTPGLSEFTSSLANHWYVLYRSISSRMFLVTIVEEYMYVCMARYLTMRSSSLGAGLSSGRLIFTAFFSETMPVCR